jgi:5-methylcytosine-specific restriction endonuclease McrA
MWAASADKKAYDADYFKKNFARISLRSKRYHERTSERRLECSRDWAARNKDKVRSIKAAYKARRRQQEQGGDSTATIHAWEKQAAKVCHWCGVKCHKLYHIDHYVPLAKGGKHEVRNLVIACRKCNLRKSARDPYEFAAAMGRLF